LGGWVGDGDGRWDGERKPLCVRELRTTYGLRVL
jgi:hypothetical protein